LPWGGQLAAFAHYDSSTSEQAVLIKIGDISPRLFLQYNRATGINAETRAHPNQVVIVRDEGKTEEVAGMQSWLVAGIMVDDEDAKPVHRYRKFDGNSDLIIEVCKKFEGGKPDYVHLSVHLDDGKQTSTCGNVGNTSSQCRDSAEDFYFPKRDTYKSCTWLSNNFNRWGDSLCQQKSEAVNVCPATCGKCDVVCGDGSGNFIVNDNIGSKRCDWLSMRPKWQARLCKDGHDAYELCRKTCGVCNRR